ILYKLLFDMKGDLHDLKQLVFELIRSNNLRLPDSLPIGAFSSADDPAELLAAEPWSLSRQGDRLTPMTGTDRPPIILDNGYDSDATPEPSLALEDMEKDMIRKSLKRD